MEEDYITWKTECTAEDRNSYTTARKEKIISVTNPQGDERMVNQ